MDHLENNFFAFYSCFDVGIPYQAVLERQNTRGFLREFHDGGGFVPWRT